jgi:glycosyltransferase involved in cell wall biosynthesis
MGEDRLGDNGAPLFCIVWIERTPESLESVPWLVSFGSTSLLARCLKMLDEAGLGQVLAVTPQTTATRVREELASSGTETFFTASQNAVAALHEVAVSLGATRCLVLHGLFGCGLFPPDCLAGLVGAHAAAKATISVATGLPAPLYAHVYERSAIELLAQIAETQLLPDDLPAVVQGVSAAFDRLPADQRDIHVLRFPVLHGNHAGTVPGFIPWQQPMDIATLADVVASTPISERLTVLRQRIISSIEAAHRPRTRYRRSSVGLPRVLFASNPSAFSGAEECLINSVRALGNCVDAWAVVALEGVFTARLRREGVKVVCPERDFATSSVRNFKYADDVLVEVAPDVIHCNATVGVPMLAAATLRGIPVMQWVRIAEMRGFEEHLWRADILTASSHFIAGELSNELVSPGKIRVLYDAVDCDRLHPAASLRRDIKAEYNILPSHRIVLCIGRFVPNKRHDVLIRAFAKVAASVPDVTLILIGQPPSAGPNTFPDSVQLVADLGLTERVVFRSFEPDVSTVEQAAEIVVLCSEREPLGTVVLESMALGKAIVVAASGGLPEMIDHGVTGLHCRLGDAESLAEQILCLLGDSDVADALRRNTRAAAVRRFGFEAHREALAGLYREVVA